MNKEVYSRTRTVIKDDVATETYSSIANYVEKQLSGVQYDDGLIESLKRQSRNNSHAIGRLLDVLVNKGIIDKEELSWVIKGWVDDQLCLKKIKP
jgi:hypothetical protein